MAIASSGGRSYSFITLAAVPPEEEIHYVQVLLVGPSEDELQLWLGFVPSQTRPLLDEDCPCHYNHLWW
jgi:hypothetical protein